MTQFTPATLSAQRTMAAISIPQPTGTPNTHRIASNAANVAAVSYNRPADIVSRDLSQKRERSLAEKLFDTRADCKIATRRFAMHFEPDWHSRFFTQLDLLFSVEEWDEDDEPVTKDSFATLVRLLLTLRDKRRPGLAIANGGNIVATWSVNSQDRLTVECLPQDRVRWIVTVPLDEGHETAVGETSLERLLLVIQAYRPQHWFGHEGSKST
jgi:hypothetical protein